MRVYFRALHDRLGLEFEPLDDNSLAVNISAYRGVITLDPEDPAYFRLTLALQPNATVSRRTMEGICLRHTATAKLVKVTLDRDGDLLLAAETVVAGHQQLPEPGYLAQVMPRIFSLLLSAVDGVHESVELEKMLIDS